MSGNADAQVEGVQAQGHLSINHIGLVKVKLPQKLLHCVNCKVPVSYDYMQLSCQHMICGKCVFAGPKLTGDGGLEIKKCRTCKSTTFVKYASGTNAIVNRIMSKIELRAPCGRVVDGWRGLKIHNGAGECDDCIKAEFNDDNDVIVKKRVTRSMKTM
jgi:hypothetical protein